MEKVYFKPEDMYSIDGSTKPILGYRDDIRYVVKYMHNPMGGKVVVNEYVSSCILNLLEIKTPKFCLLIVAEELRTFGGFIEESEIVFCSEYVEHLPLTSPYMISSVHNTEQFLEFLIFDAFLFNFDRSDTQESPLLNLGNIIYNSIDKSVYLIDHSHILDPYDMEWNDDIVDFLDIPHNVTINKLFDLTIYDTLYNNGFLKFSKTQINNIKKKYAKINLGMLENIVNSIPISWGCISLNEKEKLIEFLIKRLKQISDIIDMIVRKLKGEKI